MLTPRPVCIIAAATDNATLVRGAPCRLAYASASSLNDAPVYVKFYNKATAPTSADTPVFVMMVPANATATNGAGSNMPMGGVYFSLGMGYRIVKGIANNDATSVDASEVILNYAVD